MKFAFLLLVYACILGTPKVKTTTFVGSTPAHPVVRSFLGISPTDSIDFIRWKVVINESGYELNCQYGISKGGTPGFTNEKTVHLKGAVTRQNHKYALQRGQETMPLLEVNENLLHLLDHDDHMLVGNGGYSYVLNNTSLISTGDFNIAPKQTREQYPLVFEGRTPCQELSKILELNKRAACNKMKWYILLYADSVTGKPSYYLKGGMGYRKETMDKGKWQIQTLKNGRILYQIIPNDNAYTLNLLKGDDNILFFVRPDGNLLVGNEDFSYTLNRRNKEHDPIKR